MAAPSTAYTGLSLFIGDCEHGQAKLAPDYNTFKTRFYLDDVIGGKEGVVGLVNPSGENATYHNLTTRGGKGRIGNMQMLNDGGLNTGGFAEEPILISNQNGKISVTAPLLKSAYYVDTILGGIEIATNSSFTTNRDWVDEPIPQQTSLTNLNLSTGTEFEIGQTIYYRTYLKNSEKDYFSTIKTFIVKPQFVSLRFGATITDAASSTYSDYLIDINRLVVGAHLYEYNSMGTLISNVTAGYYDDGTYVYKVDEVGAFSEITAIGFSGVEGSTGGGGGSPSYVTWETWSSEISAFQAYRAYQLGKPSASYNVYDPEVSGLQNMPGAVDGYYAHIFGGEIYVHQVIGELVQSPAVATYPI